MYFSSLFSLPGGERSKRGWRKNFNTFKLQTPHLTSPPRGEGRMKLIIGSFVRDDFLYSK
jgi:hypothetical protein